jgi:hypothetical protein
LGARFADYPGRVVDLVAPGGVVSASLLLPETGAADPEYGLSVSADLIEGPLQFDLGFRVARDQGSVLGFAAPEGDAPGTDLAALTLGLSQEFAGGGFFALSAEMGLADLAAPAAFSALSSARFDSVGLDFGRRGVFAAGDRLAFGVALPLAVTGGQAEMILPVAGDGSARTAGFESVVLGLAPEERQIDLSVSYQMPLGEGREMLFEVIHAENYGNRAGLTETAAVLALKFEF